MHTQPTLKSMTFEEYADEQDWVSDYMDSMYWEGGLDTEKCFEAVIDEASKDGVVLTDVDTFKYDRYFYDWYQAIEKGLS